VYECTFHSKANPRFSVQLDPPLESPLSSSHITH
jgi:hypothetical protein